VTIVLDNIISTSENFFKNLSRIEIALLNFSLMAFEILKVRINKIMGFQHLRNQYKLQEGKCLSWDLHNPPASGKHM
jgi:hypothetical protein